MKLELENILNYDKIGSYYSFISGSQRTIKQKKGIGQ